MSGVMADCTISATVRKLFRSLESHGLITSVSPTFSIRTDRDDSQVWKKAPSEFIPTPIGVRQLRPSIVPPCTTLYFCVPLVILWTWTFGTSVASVFVPQGKTKGLPRSTGAALALWVPLTVKAMKHSLATQAFQ